MAKSAFKIAAQDDDSPATGTYASPSDSATEPTDRIADLNTERDRDDILLTNDGHIRRLVQIEGDVIRVALDLYGGSVTETARRLGIGRSTLYRKMETHRIKVDADELGT